MKKLNSIFVFIFLTGICLTLLNYFPLLEEEGLTHNLELVKKDCKDDTSGNDNQGDDNDPEIEKTDLWNIGHFQRFNLSVSLKIFLYTTQIYDCVLSKISTPPPQV